MSASFWVIKPDWRRMLNILPISMVNGLLSLLRYGDAAVRWLTVQ
jgi:hypothetical protein